MTDAEYRQISRIRVLDQPYRSVWIASLAIMNVFMFLWLIFALGLIDHAGLATGMVAVVGNMIKDHHVDPAVLIAIQLTGNLVFIALGFLLPGQTTVRTKTFDHPTQSSEL